MRWLSLYSKLSGTAGFLADPALLMAERLSSTHAALRQRRGSVPQKVMQKAPFDIWMHGASVGEMSAVKAIADKVFLLRPGTKLLVSAFTDSGVKQAERLFKDKASVIYCPIDYPQAVEKAVSIVAPRLFCPVETEIWPNFLWILKKQGTRLLLLNARISEGSFPRYKRLRFFFKEVLGLLDLICAISKGDKKRLAGMGADPEKVFVCGNAKYEYLLERPNETRVGRIGATLNLPVERYIVTAGSLRQREHIYLYRAFERLKGKGVDAFFILVPRHLERVDEIRDFLSSKGARFQLLTDIMDGSAASKCKEADFLIVNKMGWLFDIYSLCHVAYVGGSLVAAGGQNLMEPAAWRKPVLFGPHVENFQDAALALKKEGGGFVVKDWVELSDRLMAFLTNKELRKGAGEAAYQALLELGAGAATKQAEEAVRILDMTGTP